jgi:hypothetical protein
MEFEKSRDKRDLDLLRGKERVVGYENLTPSDRMSLIHLSARVAEDQKEKPRTPQQPDPDYELLTPSEKLEYVRLPAHERAAFASKAARPRRNQTAR